MKKAKKNYPKITSLFVTALVILSSGIIFAFIGSSNSNQSYADAQCGVAPRYPFSMPSKQTLRSYDKKVFGFYFPPFPISIDNKDPSVDFWDKWYNKLGNETTDPTNDLRDRPLYQRPPLSGDWRLEDFEVEVQQAIDAGLDGFIYEHNSTTSDNRFKQLNKFLDAARNVDPDFKVMLSPDFPLSDNNPQIVADGLLPYKDHPSLYKDNNGDIVLAPFYPERKSITYWNNVRSILQSSGMNTSLFPIFLWWNGTNTIWTSEGQSNLMDWDPHIIGYSVWGGASYDSGVTSNAANEAHNRGKMWMNPVMLEDVRHTKNNGAKYYESYGSTTLRNGWQRSMNAEAEITYLRTWNDYAESWVAPSVERGTSVLDVSAYYSLWHKTGQKPSITHDAFYYFHRSQRTDAPYDTSLYTTGGGSLTPIQLSGAGPKNEVELLAFLKSPGKLTIKQGGNVQTMDAPAGITSFKAPIVPGTTPEFKLERSNQNVHNINSQTPIRSSVKYQDFMYHAGGSVAPNDCSPTNPADINSDNVVDIVDLSILLSNWNNTSGPSDINSDGKVDIVDLSILLSNWG